MKIDLHVHTRLSYDSRLEPIHLIERARKLRLDAVCVTEHWSYKASEPIEEVATAEGFLVLRGAEYHSAQGHLLLYGIYDDSYCKGNKYLSTQEVIDYVNDMGGVVVPSHPYIDWAKLESRTDGIKNPPSIEKDKVMGDNIYQLSGIIAIETLNAAMTRLIPGANDKAEVARKKLGLPGIGGSDAHTAWEVGLAYTVFEAEIKNIHDLVEALRTGKYYPEEKRVL